MPPVLSTDERVGSAVAACAGRQAIDVVVLDLAALSGFTDYFVIASGNSDRHVQAIAQAVDDALDQKGARPLDIEGLREGQWVLLDYGDVLVHVFERGKRDFYRLERLWADAPDVTARFAAGAR